MTDLYQLTWGEGEPLPVYPSSPWIQVSRAARLTARWSRRRSPGWPWQRWCPAPTTGSPEPRARGGAPDERLRELPSREPGVDVARFAKSGDRALRELDRAGEAATTTFERRLVAIGPRDVAVLRTEQLGQDRACRLELRDGFVEPAELDERGRQLPVPHGDVDVLAPEHPLAICEHGADQRLGLAVLAERDEGLGDVGA